eukprot:1142708-Pelagomonas_calceolata.AAC.2
MQAHPGGRTLHIFNSTLDPHFSASACKWTHARLDAWPRLDHPRLDAWHAWTHARLDASACTWTHARLDMDACTHASTLLRQHRQGIYKYTAEVAQTGSPRFVSSAKAEHCLPPSSTWNVQLVDLCLLASQRHPTFWFVFAKAEHCLSPSSIWNAAAKWWFSMGERSLYLMAKGSFVLTRKSLL